MDLLAYASDDEVVAQESGPAPNAAAGAAPKAMARKPPAGFEGGLDFMPLVNAAPDVELLDSDLVGNVTMHPKDKRMLTNPKFSAMNKLLVDRVVAEAEEGKIKMTGRVEKANMAQVNFDKEYNSFHNWGFAANPARDTRGVEVLETTEGPVQRGKTMWDRKPATTQAPIKKRRVEGPDGEEEEAIVPVSDAAAQWGGFEDEGTVRKQAEEEIALREEEVARQREEERAVEGEERETKERITSIFHGSKETDYAGRSWLVSKTAPPKDVDDKQCFLPKKWIHTWSGHTMGVQQIRWFPKTAHMLLSAGMDSTIKIWDYQNQRKCLRTYMGHDQAVRDINFTADGSRFYSVSYDKNIQYWDTETGQVISTFTNKKTNFCVVVHPDESQQNVIICGCSNKKAVQWDANSNSIVQEYDEHMGAVNTVTFCEEGKRIITTSDDKKIYVWEFGIPVVVKHIAEPTMHSVPAVTLDPSKRFLIGQSMDNKIITYEAFGRFKFQGKRQFKGHLNAGYAITPSFSADSKWVMSGDLEGKLWFWDWQKCKNYRTLKAHDGVCMSCMWHPTQPSRVVTCGWDGAIKLWD